jgi:hypothetical protein
MGFILEAQIPLFEVRKPFKLSRMTQSFFLETLLKHFS